MKFYKVFGGDSDDAIILCDCWDSDELQEKCDVFVEQCRRGSEHPRVEGLVKYLHEEGIEAMKFDFYRDQVSIEFKV